MMLSFFSRFRSKSRRKAEEARRLFDLKWKWSKTNDDVDYEFWRTCQACHTYFIDPVALPCLHTICYRCLSIHVNNQKIQIENEAAYYPGKYLFLRYCTVFTCPLCNTPLYSKKGVDLFKYNARHLRLTFQERMRWHECCNGDFIMQYDGELKMPDLIFDQNLNIRQLQWEAIARLSRSMRVQHQHEQAEAHRQRRRERIAQAGDLPMIMPPEEAGNDQQNGNGENNRGASDAHESPSRGSGGSEADRESGGSESQGAASTAEGESGERRKDSSNEKENENREGAVEDAGDIGVEGAVKEDEEGAVGGAMAAENVEEGAVGGAMAAENIEEGAVGGALVVANIEGAVGGRNPNDEENDRAALALFIPDDSPEISIESDPTDPEEYIFGVTEKYVASDDPVVRRILKYGGRDRAVRRLETARIFRVHMSHLYRHRYWDRVDPLEVEDIYSHTNREAVFLETYDLKFGDGDLDVLHPMAIALNPLTGHLVVADSSLNKAVLFRGPQQPVASRVVNNPVTVLCFMQSTNQIREEHFCFGGHSRVNELVTLFCVPFNEPSQVTAMVQPVRDISGLLMRGPENRLVMCLPHKDEVSGEDTSGCFQTIASAEGQGLCYPTYIIEGHYGELIFSDTNNHRIVKMFGPDNMGVQYFGEYGSKPGEFFLPMGLALDSKRRLFVCDANNYRVQVVGRDWQFESVPITRTFRLGQKVSQDVKPVDCAVDSRDRLTVLFRGREFASIRVYHYVEPLQEYQDGSEIIVVDESFCANNCFTCYTCCRRHCSCCYRQSHVETSDYLHSVCRSFERRPVTRNRREYEQLL